MNLCAHKARDSCARKKLTAVYSKIRHAPKQSYDQVNNGIKDKPIEE